MSRVGMDGGLSLNRVIVRNITNKIACSVAQRIKQQGLLRRGCCIPFRLVSTY